MRVDLHIHTTASDGRWTPQEVVERVQAAGIGLFAVADHDAVDNLRPTAEEARRAGLAFLPAVEISARLNGREVHILAYGIDPDHPDLKWLVESNRALLEWANEETLRRLAKAGYPIDLKAYEDYQYDPSRGGWKALNYLIDLGICRDVRDFFDRLYVEPYRPPDPEFPHPGEVAAVVQDAGGVPVLAHPGMSLRGQGITPESLVPFLESGIAGLECYSFYHDPQTTRACLSFCARYDLLITGGSDCHGGFANRQLGVPPVYLGDLRLGPLVERVLW